MQKIVIVGSSGHAKVIIDIVRQEGKYEIAGLLDRFRDVGEETMGCQVLGQEEDLPTLVNEHGIEGALVAIGDNFVRATVAQRIQELCPDLPFVKAIHPKASIASEVTIGAGTVVMAGVSVNSGSTVGRFCILNTNSSFDHDSVLGDYASLAPGASAGGNCRVGDYTAICIGTVMINGMHVGEHTVVGAGSLVVEPVEPYVVAHGSPAKPVRSREPGDKYL